MGFGRGRHVEEDTTSYLRIVSRRQNVDAQHNANTATGHSESRTSTLHKISNAASVRPEESAPLLSRRVQSGANA